MEESDQFLYAHSKCVICDNVMVANIFICTQGHSVCNDCRNNIPRCPTCRAAFTSGRNYQLEDLIKECKHSIIFINKIVNCSFQEEGCTYSMQVTQKNEHERNCSFRKIACSFTTEGCSMILLKKDMIGHEMICPFKTVPCKFARFGCKEKCKFQDMLNHEENCTFNISKGIKICNDNKYLVANSFNDNIIKCNLCNLILSGDVYTSQTRQECSNCKLRHYNHDRTVVRNPHLKQLIQEINQFILVPCTFAKDGCPIAIQLFHKDQHETKCDFRDVNCELNNCTWNGKIISLLKHLQVHSNEEVKILEKKTSQFKTKFLWNHNTNIINALVCDSDVFYLKYIKNASDVKFIMQLVGTPGKACKFSYEFEVEGNENKCGYKDTCASDSQKLDFIISRGNYILLDNCKMENYMNKDYNLDIFITITPSI